MKLIGKNLKDPTVAFNSCICIWKPFLLCQLYSEIRETEASHAQKKKEWLKNAENTVERRRKNLGLHPLKPLEALLSTLSHALLLWLKYFLYTVPSDSRTVHGTPHVNVTALGWVRQPSVYRLGSEGWDHKDRLKTWDKHKNAL